MSKNSNKNNTKDKKNSKYKDENYKYKTVQQLFSHLHLKRIFKEHHSYH